MIKKDKAISGAIILGAGTFISKLLGALYRIPLTALIKSVGLGIYQTVFPVYALLLDFSGAGAPNAISKIVSSKNSDREKINIIKVSLIFFILLGIFFSLILFLFSNGISKLQGNSLASIPYKFLSPAIFIVCGISCFKGYFLGRLNTKPSAISQIIEQSVKLILGLLLCFLFKSNTVYAVSGAVFAITISEVFALVYLFIEYKKDRKNLPLFYKLDDGAFNYNLKTIIRFALPITILGIILPFSQVADSFVIINKLSNTTKNATAIYGIYSGACLAIINLPVSICYGLSAVSIPAISSAKNKQKGEENSNRLLILTFIVSAIFATIIYFTSSIIVNVLYRSFSIYEKELCIDLIQITSPAIVLLSVLQTTNAVLIGKNKLYYPIVGMICGVVIKLIMNITLLENSGLGIYLPCISLVICYLVADIINLSSIIKIREQNVSSPYQIRKTVYEK